MPDFRERVAWGHTTPRTVRAAGLPNIAGGCPANSQAFQTGGTGSLWTTWQAGTRNGSAKNDGYSYINFDASRSSSIYGNSTTVQPPALTTRFLIRAKS